MQYKAWRPARAPGQPVLLCIIGVRTAAQTLEVGAGSFTLSSTLSLTAERALRLPAGADDCCCSAGKVPNAALRAESRWLQSNESCISSAHSRVQLRQVSVAVTVASTAEPAQVRTDAECWELLFAAYGTMLWLTTGSLSTDLYDKPSMLGHCSHFHDLARNKHCQAGKRPNLHKTDLVGSEKLSSIACHDSSWVMLYVAGMVISFTFPHSG